MIRLADEPWAPVAQGHPGAEVVRCVRVALRGTNGGDHPCRRKKTMVQNPGQPATWVHRFVIGRLLLMGAIRHSVM
jgi:hypothetical protein